MLGRTRQVIVEVSPTRHELAVFEQGRLIGHRASRPAEGLGLSEWPAILRSLEAELENWVPDLGVRGEPVVVVYTGPDTAASMFDAPASAGEQRARLAAKLAMAGTISFPLEQNAHTEISLFRDGSAREGEQPKLRTLALADTEATILSLAMAIERGGLRPTGFVPAPGASLAAAVHALRCSAAAGSPGVVLWIGEHSSVIAGGEGDRLSFARLIPVGTETMVEALSAPVTAGRTDNTIALDRFSARELLFASGIPTVDGWSDSTTTIDPNAVLPLLQPVLQRLAVETKQSIRFGFAPEQRPRVRLRVAGPGASISGLGATCAAGVGVQFVQEGHGAGIGTAGASGIAQRNGFGIAQDERRMGLAGFVFQSRQQFGTLAGSQQSAVHKQAEGYVVEPDLGLFAFFSENKLPVAGAGHRNAGFSHLLGDVCHYGFLVNGRNLARRNGAEPAGFFLVHPVERQQPQHFVIPGHQILCNRT